jgi:hypothetical protein
MESRLTKPKQNTIVSHTYNNRQGDELYDHRQGDELSDHHGMIQNLIIVSLN